MNIDLFEVVVVIVVAGGTLAAYILKAKIAPIKSAGVATDVRLDTLQITLLDTLTVIKEGNASFRLKYEKDTGELKLLLSEHYAKSDDVKELRDLVTALTTRIKVLEQVKQGGG